MEQGVANGKGVGHRQIPGRRTIKKNKSIVKDILHLSADILYCCLFKQVNVVYINRSVKVLICPGHEISNNSHIQLDLFGNDEDIS